MNIPLAHLPRMVVFGCGFTGLKFIKRIDDRRYQSLLLAKSNHHSFSLSFAKCRHEPDSIVYLIRKVFEDKKNFYSPLSVLDRVVSIKKEFRYQDRGTMATIVSNEGVVGICEI